MPAPAPRPRLHIYTSSHHPLIQPTRATQALAGSRPACEASCHRRRWENWSFGWEECFFGEGGTALPSSTRATKPRMYGHSSGGLRSGKPTRSVRLVVVGGLTWGVADVREAGQAGREQERRRGGKGGTATAADAEGRLLGHRGTPVHMAGANAGAARHEAWHRAGGARCGTAQRSPGGWHRGDRAA